MRAFFEARIEHLTVADRVRVECRIKVGGWLYAFPTSTDIHIPDSPR